MYFAFTFWITLVFAIKEIWLEVNTDKTKYIFMSWDQNAGRSHNVTIDNSSFERVEEFRYLGTTLKNQNSIEEEIKNGLKLWKCLLSFGAESFAFQFAVQKYKGSDIQNYIFTCYFLWVWNLVAHIERKT